MLIAALLALIPRVAFVRPTDGTRLGRRIFKTGKPLHPTRESPAPPISIWLTKLVRNPNLRRQHLTPPSMSNVPCALGGPSVAAMSLL